MLVKEMMEVIAEDRAEENFKLYWSWILHNFIHRINTSRIPALHCVGNVHGKKWPGLTYLVYSAGGDEVPVYVLTYPRYIRDLRQYHEESPPILISTSLSGYCKMNEDSVRLAFGMPAHLEFPAGCTWLITGSEPLRHNKRLERPPHPWEPVMVTCSFSNALQKIPRTVEDFDNEEFERYLLGEPCSMDRLDLDPKNSVYFLTDPNKYKIVKRLHHRDFGSLGHEDDDVTDLLEIN